MTKRWLTDKSYSIWGYVLRLLYWLVAVYLSQLFLQSEVFELTGKIGLLILSSVFVIIFLLFTRFIDRFLDVNKHD